MLNLNSTVPELTCLEVHESLTGGDRLVVMVCTLFGCCQYKSL